MLQQAQAAVGICDDRLSAKLLRAFNRVFCHSFHRVYLQSPCPIPDRGAGIVVCNHISGLDPLLLQSAIRRPVIWMMASEYYESKLLNWLFRAVQAIPVQRSGRDMAATRAALRHLEQGHIVGIFPEGRIETSRELLPFHTGVAMMAHRAGVPIYPAYLEGTNRGMEMIEAFVNPNDVRLRFGGPMQLPGRAEKPDLVQETARVQEVVSKLRSAMVYNHI